MGLNWTGGGLTGLRVDKRPNRTGDRGREKATRGFVRSRRPEEEERRGEMKALVMRRVEERSGEALWGIRDGERRSSEAPQLL